ncbi:hypothetical protein F2Q69_00006738 [Brassica cretica]|uniref:Ubiquitin-like protease family profile domain-containing protein n=1 Tax=Brassica cretica TaxID=69181 RepID=A0A8S9PK23_BRACR|nr:hypothetical protein F2Q69_00006738 [Brassica cretica]
MGITTKVIIPNQPERGQGYNPFAGVDRQKLSVLLDWVKLDVKWRQKVAGSSSFWFYTLLTPKEWLNDTHLEWFRSDIICMMDDVFTQMWTAKYSEFLDSPANPDGSACWISIPRRHIVIWDSDVVYTKDEEIAKTVKPIAHMLSYMLHMLSPGEDRELYTVDFTHERVSQSRVPQNKQSGDCRVYFVKYIECHALGMPFPSHDMCDKNIKTIRSQMATEIFVETNINGTEKRLYKHLNVYD